MADTPATQFLDVPRLLQASLPKPRTLWTSYTLIFLTILVLTTAWAGNSDPRVQVLGGLVIFGVVVATGVLTSRAARAQRQEQQRVEAIEELVQLRRWDQAAAMLNAMLGQPTRSPAARLQALIYLASVLARYHRFADAITVQNYLLENAQYDPGTAHGIRLMRTMAMLHEDQLVDADRAIGDLRREAPESAGLALIEIYRDVRTGHPAEAIELFNARLPAMRSQLGHRVGDAYALVARAHDSLGQDAEAAAAFEKATLLAPVEELVRRYPEVAALAEKYPAAPAPREAA
jgi:tetratricopeptide (TPR) repeat protein